MSVVLYSIDGTRDNDQKGGLKNCKIGSAKIEKWLWMGSNYLWPTKEIPNRVRIISEFWNLNRQLKRKIHPMPKIREMLSNLEGFQYATSMDLNLGYYHIHLSKEAGNVFIIILPRRKYKWKLLQIGVCNYPKIFQGEMSKIFYGFELNQAYIDDLLIITKVNWSNHLVKLELTLKILREKRLMCNTEKSFFGQIKIDYLGYWVTQNGIRSVKIKIRIHSNYDTTKKT